MPAWEFLPLLLVAAIACPMSMLVMGKITRGKVSCIGCLEKEPGSATEASLLERKAALERQIAELKAARG